MLIHSGEEGVIVDFINKKMVMVDVGGVTFPVYTDQIDFPYFQKFSKPKPVAPSRGKVFVEDLKPEKKTNRYGLGTGIWLVWMPVFDKDVFDDDVVDYFKLYLINQTEDALIAHYQLFYDRVKDIELKNEILPFSDNYLHDFPFDRLNDVPRLVFEFTLRQTDKKRASHYESVYKPKAKQVFKQVEEMRLRQKAHFHIPLLEEWPLKPEGPGLDFGRLDHAGFKFHAKQSRSSESAHLRTVVDLHIDKLTDNWKSLPVPEILDMQLSAFEKFYENALHHHQGSLIVIHGVGTGRLRDEIHDILRQKKEVKSFVNQFHPLYGFGATEIYFQY